MGFQRLSIIKPQIRPSQYFVDYRKCLMFLGFKSRKQHDMQVMQQYKQEVLQHQQNCVHLHQQHHLLASASSISNNSRGQKYRTRQLNENRFRVDLPYVQIVSNEHGFQKRTVIGVHYKQVRFISLQDQVDAFTNAMHSTVTAGYTEDVKDQSMRNQELSVKAITSNCDYPIHAIFIALSLFLVLINQMYFCLELHLEIVYKILQKYL